VGIRATRDTSLPDRASGVARLYNNHLTRKVGVQAWVDGPLSVYGVIASSYDE